MYCIVLSFSASRELRFVVIGETGAGKSETCNSILLNRNMFSSSIMAKSETKTCKVQQAEVLDRTISVVDTPGLFDADMDQRSLLREITRCTMMTAPGPHAILLVIRIGRLSQQVQETVRVFREVFGEGCINHLVVVFTGKNMLAENSCTFEEYRDTVNLGDVAEILKDCNDRCVVFENSVEPDSEENTQQVEELISVVDEMLKSNGGGCYTNQMFKEVELKIKDREEALRRQYEEEKREEMQSLTLMYEEQLKEMEIGMTETLHELITQNREHELKELEERYRKKDPRREARKEAETGSWWETLLDLAPGLLKLVFSGVQIVGIVTGNPIAKEVSKYGQTLIDLIPKKDKMKNGKK